MPDGLLAEVFHKLLRILTESGLSEWQRVEEKRPVVFRGQRSDWADGLETAER